MATRYVQLLEKRHLLFKRALHQPFLFLNIHARSQHIQQKDYMQKLTETRRREKNAPAFVTFGWRCLAKSRAQFVGTLLSI